MVSGQLRSRSDGKHSIRVECPARLVQYENVLCFLMNPKRVTYLVNRVKSGKFRRPFTGELACERVASECAGTARPF